MLLWLKQRQNVWSKCGDSMINATTFLKNLCNCFSSTNAVNGDIIVASYDKATMKRFIVNENVLPNAGK